VRWPVGRLYSPCPRDVPHAHLFETTNESKMQSSPAPAAVVQQGRPEHSDSALCGGSQNAPWPLADTPHSISLMWSQPKLGTPAQRRPCALSRTLPVCGRQHRQLCAAHRGREEGALKCWEILAAPWSGTISPALLSADSAYVASSVRGSGLGVSPAQTMFTCDKMSSI
jgi:hypothetical protein